MRDLARKHYSSLLDWLDDSHRQHSPLLSSCRYLLRIVFITIRQFQRHNLTLRASALTLTILLSLVPILAMSTAVVKGLGGDNHLKQIAYHYIAILEEQGLADDPNPQPVSGSSLTDHLRAAVDKIFAYVDQTNFTTLGTIGTIGLIFSIMLVLDQIETAMNIIWHVKNSRSILRKISDYITLLVLMPLAVNVGFAASALIESPVLLAKVDAYIPALWLQGILLKTIPVFFIALMLCVIYIFFPNTRVRTLPAFTGAILAAICWFTVQSICISMQIDLSRYNTIYGSFATLPLLLIWIHLVWIIILAGAQLACVLQNSSRLSLNPAQVKQAQRLDAAFAVMIEVQQAFLQQRPLTVKELENILVDHRQQAIQEAMEKLVGAGLIHRSSTDDRLLPAGPADSCSPSRLLALIAE